MKVRVYYSYPVRVKTKRKKLKRIPVRESGFEACGNWITRKKILASKYLNRKEKQILLDMCNGVSVQKKKRIDRGFDKQIAEYLVHGKVYRDGSIVEFDQTKITNAIFKALTATGQGDGTRSKKISDRVIQILNRRFKKEEIPQVEQVQDIVEEVLILENLVETAKAYILYREQRRKIREAVGALDESVEMVDKYIKELDWQIKENANMAYSLQGLNYYGVAAITKKYWLNKVYPKKIREALESGDFHIHDLDNLSTYCSGWDLYDLLLKGFRGVPGKVESKPPKHFRTALGQLVNFFYTLQGESAGAEAISSFDMFMHFTSIKIPESL